MLRLYIPGTEDFDETTQEFVTSEAVVLELEHSLATLSKWESIHETPFLTNKDLTREQTLSYILVMIQNEVVPGRILQRLTEEHLSEIKEYIGRKMTATWFAEDPNPKPPKEVITAEIIYYWMISANVPFECQHWHLSKLLTLIRVCSMKNQPPKKMSRREVMERNRMLNAQRRAQSGSKG